MTASATDVIDPSGLGGERLVRNEKQAPYIVECWAYPARITFDTIKAAWLEALPLGSCAGFTAEGFRGGKRLITIDRFEKPT
jgi:hypothetical protein